MDVKNNGQTVGLVELLLTKSRKTDSESISKLNNSSDAINVEGYVTKKYSDSDVTLRIVPGEIGITKDEFVRQMIYLSIFSVIYLATCISGLVINRKKNSK